MPAPSVTAVQPAWAVEGGRVSIRGSDFPVDQPRLPDVRIGGVSARVVYASASQIDAVVPEGIKAGRASVQVDGCRVDTASVEVAGVFATELHQVDNPAFDHGGNLYLTFSGTRGQEVPV